MLSVHESVKPLEHDGTIVLPAKKDGKSCYLARRDGITAWGYSINEALSALKFHVGIIY